MDEWAGQIYGKSTSNSYPFCELTSRVYIIVPSRLRPLQGPTFVAYGFSFGTLSNC